MIINGVTGEEGVWEGERERKKASCVTEVVIIDNTKLMLFIEPKTSVFQAN